MQLDIPLHLMPKSRMRGAIPLGLFFSSHLVSLMLLTSVSLTGKMTKVGYSKSLYFFSGTKAPKYPVSFLNKKKNLLYDILAKKK